MIKNFGMVSIASLKIQGPIPSLSNKKFLAYQIVESNLRTGSYKQVWSRNSFHKNLWFEIKDKYSEPKLVRKLKIVISLYPRLFRSGVGGAGVRTADILKRFGNGKSILQNLKKRIAVLNFFWILNQIRLEFLLPVGSTYVVLGGPTSLAWARYCWHPINLWQRHIAPQNTVSRRCADVKTLCLASLSKYLLQL